MCEKALRPATILKRASQQRCFPVKFAKFLRTPILKICERLLLKRLRNPILTLKRVKSWNCNIEVQTLLYFF